MKLPIFQREDDKDFNMMQTSWASKIEPVLNKPFNSGLLLKEVVLASGDNVINHKLGRNLQGWIITRMINSFVQLYDKQDTNQMKDKTLVLNSSGVGKIDLLVF